MDKTEISINPGEIEINLKLIARLMGLDPENIPEPYGELIQTEILESEKYRNIKGGYIISDNISIDPSAGIFNYGNVEFSAGMEVVGDLTNSDSLALFVCTAGEEVTLRSKELMGSGKHLEGYIADLTGSVLVEEAMDIVHGKLKRIVSMAGLQVTNRYSPGYCHWNVIEQQKLFHFIPVGFCGIKLSASSLMYPIKSVSGVIGIGKSVIFRKHRCNACTKTDCIYRNIKYAGLI